MKIARLRLSNFQSFGEEATDVTFAHTTYLIGPNGSGKTAILQALCRLFAFVPSMRRIQPSDFNVPVDEDDPPPERTLFLEVDIELPEAENGDGDQFTIPPCFKHMRLEGEHLTPRVRYRLEASMGPNGDIDEKLSYVIQVDEDDKPTKVAAVAREDRNYLCVHYIPARRDPSDHIAYSTNSMLGRLLRASDWSAEQKQMDEASDKINSELCENPTIKGLSENLSSAWGVLSKGNFFKNPKISFSSSSIDHILKQISLSFSPGHGEQSVDYSRLSDGQKSLLYLSLIVSARSLEVDALRGNGEVQIDPTRARVPVFTLIALEEPENSLAPHYLGRIVSMLNGSAKNHGTQSVVATHAPSMLKRVDPKNIRHTRLNGSRNTMVTEIPLPHGSCLVSDRKFVREAVQAFPEIYFARLVILGEGDSEEIVLPRIFRDVGLPCDEIGIIVAPLGGRHVNYFWKILSTLGIPYVTLLDLDTGRFGGGWGRIRYAAKQLLEVNDENKYLEEIGVKDLEVFSRWDKEGHSIIKFPKYLRGLASHHVHFSSPLDLDFTMIEHFPAAYAITEEEREEPDTKVIYSVLGKKGRNPEQYPEISRNLFAAYHNRFKTSSKPASHLEALSRLTASQLSSGLPEQYKNLVADVRELLEAIPE